MMARLGKRERTVLWIGIVFVLSIALWSFAIKPALNHKASLKKNIKRYKNELVELAILKDDFRKMKEAELTAQRQIGQRGPGFKLFTFMNQLAKEAGVKKNVDTMRPSQAPIPDSPFKKSTVDIKLKGLSMEELSDYLFKIESSPKNVSIKRISITEAGKNNQLIDVGLQVEILET